MNRVEEAFLQAPGNLTFVMTRTFGTLTDQFNLLTHTKVYNPVGWHNQLGTPVGEIRACTETRRV